MSLPPQILRIKRKRVDEPVDALYIETSRSDSKRRHTQHDYVFRRLVSNEAVFPLPSPPVVSDWPHSATLANPPEHQSAAPASKSETLETSPTTSNVYKATRAVPIPRRFHLSRSALTEQPPPSTGKRRRSQEEMKIAVFVETVDAQSRIPIAGFQPAEDVTINPPKAEAPSPTRKRPGTRSNVAKASIPVQTPRTSNFEDAYAAMQEYADEMDAAQQSKATDKETVNDDAMDTSDEFIYDTYIRHSNPVEASDAVEMAIAADAAKGPIGYLVIPEADQPLWETYYDSDAHSSDEQDWDSEQDDENAENYYGADYPEDEVDSADEQDGDAYRYRRGASDEEEYGSGDDAWSDEGADGVESWNDVTGFEAHTGRKVLKPDAESIDAQ